MILELMLSNFKSFLGSSNVWGPAGVTIPFGGFSVLVGTNASGKSNIRDGLRFIHGVSRGYAVGEIIGGKYGEGGELQWRGIRGGVRETVTRNGGTTGAARFTIRVKTEVPDEDAGGAAEYAVSVDVGEKNRPPAIIKESLGWSNRYPRIFETWNSSASATATATIGTESFVLRSDRPAIIQLVEDPRCPEEIRNQCRAFLRTISSIRFLDLDPNSLRRPSIPGQVILGDRGENLSSVLQATCADPAAKESLIEWTRELTPLDVKDLKFPEVSLEGRIQLQLIENGGREVSAESASDGTLRFLAFAGAVLGTEPARCYFFEEIENGIHPSRSHLLVNLLQNATRAGKTQVIGTTHSPALLNFLDEESLGDASLVYRVGPASKVLRLAHIPALKELPPGTRAGDLLGSGWFENVAAFLEPEPTK